jgi:uncharacterized protein with NRDE domain
MCLIVLGCALRADFPLIIAANRDEYFARPTEPAGFWPDAPSVLAGRDLEQGGTWFGVTRSGRIAAVTNFRDGTRKRSGRLSRGWLVRDFLLSSLEPSSFLSQVRAAADQYDGFNLLAGTTARGLSHYSNRGAEVTPLPPGTHGLSNHLLNTPWPKVERARRQLAALADTPAQALPDALFGLLADTTLEPDAALPDTGIGLEWERALSTAMIRTPDYGTRSSTVVLVDRTGQMRFEERTFAPDGSTQARRRHALRLNEPAWLENGQD